MTPQTSSPKAPSRACVAIVLFALTCGACDTPRTDTAPTPPATGLTPPLGIAAFSVTASVEGLTYVYGPTLTLTAGPDAVTVTDLWIELEDRSNGWGSYLRDPRLPYRIPAGATRQLFDDPPADFVGTDFRAERAWAVIAYVDDSGRSARIETSAIAPASAVRP